MKLFHFVPTRSEYPCTYPNEAQIPRIRRELLLTAKGTFRRVLRKLLGR